MPTKRVVVHYRRITDGLNNQLSPTPVACLEQALSHTIGGVAFGDNDALRVRQEPNERSSVLLSPSIVGQLAFGEIASLRDGDVPVAETTASGEIELRSIPLDNQTHVVVGSSYFLVQGPHVALVHQDSSSAKVVREYLNWCFRQPIGPLAASSFVDLVPYALAGGRPVGLSGVKSLKVLGHVRRASQPVAATRTSAGQREALPLTPRAARQILRSIGLTPGTLSGLSDAELDEFEFELIVKRRARRTLEVLPQELVDGIFSDGIDQAAEFQSEGATRRGEAVVVTHRGEVATAGPYLDYGSVRRLMAEAFSVWASQNILQ